MPLASHQKVIIAGVSAVVVAAAAVTIYPSYITLTREEDPNFRKKEVSSNNNMGGSMWSRMDAKAKEK